MLMFLIATSVLGHGAPYHIELIGIIRHPGVAPTLDQAGDRILDHVIGIRLKLSFISHNLADVMELIAAVVFKRMDERLMDYIIEKSEDGRLSATHQTIANELGTAREEVSRLLKDFERRGLIILSRNYIQLVNLEFT
jgi:CRP/FNR family transcriptional regulator